MAANNQSEAGGTDAAGPAKEAGTSGEIPANFATSSDIDELPPVPQLTIERPKPPVPKGAGPGALGSGGVAVRLVQAAARTSGGQDGSAGSAPGNVRGMGQAMTIGTSLVASIIVGTGFGWLVDHYLLHLKNGGTPWGLIAGFMLGVVSGFINLVRIANDLNKS